MSMLEGIKTISDIDLAHRRVLIRADLDVDLDSASAADARIGEALPTIRHALDAGARVIVASHAATPGAANAPGVPSMEAIGLRLADLSGLEVHLPEDSVGDAPKKVVQDLRPGQICLLENLRLHTQEQENDVAFAHKLADLCDVYIGDDLRTARLDHASVSALPPLVRERGCGFALQAELKAFDALATSPARPFVAVLGGATLSDRVALIETLLDKVDALCVGGVMANTLLAARGVDLKASRFEGGKLALARTILEKALDLGIPLLLPVDLVVAGSPDDPDGMVVDAGHVPDAAMALDIGPMTVKAYAGALAGARTLLWHGPMGLANKPPFAQGTLALARAMSGAPGFTVVCGTDSAAAAAQAGQEQGAHFGHVSTSGALLDLLAGKRLPGIEALRTTTTDT